MVVVTAACTTDGGTDGDVAGTSPGPEQGTSASVLGNGSTGTTGLTGTTAPAAGAMTVAEAYAELDARFGPEIALDWQPDILAPCPPSPFSVLDLDSHVLSASGAAQLDPAALDAVLDRVATGGRTIPAVDGHRLIVGDGWEALVAVQPPADGGAAVDLTVDVVVAVLPAPLPPGVVLHDRCDEPTRPSYQTTGSAPSG